ncbi:HIT-like domain-containing protein [Nemania serpens]|nr:HIT-like domain-containing protein [Nemania serpens]
MASCLFCKIIKGEIPSFKLFESDKTLAFLDIGPLSKGHAVSTTTHPDTDVFALLLVENRDTEMNVSSIQLVIPKFHGAKLTDIPDDHLSEILPVAKKLVAATGAVDYNILQNNGRIAHQIVDHVHFHMIPKPNEQEGLGVGWPTKAADMDALKRYFEEVKSKM